MLEGIVKKTNDLIDTGIDKSIPFINKIAKAVVNATEQPTEVKSPAYQLGYSHGKQIANFFLSNKKDNYTVTDTTLNLVKGGTLNLTKATGGLTQFKLNLSWEGDTDLDVSAFVLNDQGKRTDVCFYNNLKAPGLTHSGDIKGGGQEEIDINTDELTAGRVVVAMTSHSASAADPSKRGNPDLFGRSVNPVAKLINPKTGEVLVTCNLGEDATLSTALEFVEIYKREDGQYIFKNLSNPLGQDAFGLAEMDKKYPA